MTRVRGMSLVLVAAALFTAAAAWAQEEGPGFLPALLEQLGNNGWTVQERNAFAEAAAEVDWSQARTADPEAVALALCLQTRERLRLTDREQAGVALQLAVMTREMHAAGFDAHDTAVAAVSAVRSALGDIRAWMSGGRHGELGQIIRARIAEAVRSQVQVAARSQAAGAWSGDRQEAGPGSGVGAGAQGAGGPLSGHGNGR